MAYKILAILFFLPLLDQGTAVKIEDYCKLGKGHTVCKYKCKRSRSCGTTDEDFKVLSDEDRAYVLNEHNKLRERVASGGLPGFPKATNMNVLSYDKELEFLAGCWIKQCVFNHDKNRRDLKGVETGQNLAFNAFSEKLKMDHAWITERMKGWFDEYKLVSKGQAPDLVAGKIPLVGSALHFTGMCWAEVKYVGCAKLYSFREKMHRYDLYCDYKPRGNMGNQPMYLTTGKCPIEKGPGNNYSSLCGDIRAMSEDKYEPPMNLNLAMSITSFVSIFARLFAVLLALFMI